MERLIKANSDAAKFAERRAIAALIYRRKKVFLCGVSWSTIFRYEQATHDGAKTISANHIPDAGEVVDAR